MSEGTVTPTIRFRGFLPDGVTPEPPQVEYANEPDLEFLPAGWDRKSYRREKRNRNRARRFFQKHREKSLEKVLEILKEYGLCGECNEKAEDIILDAYPNALICTSKPCGHQVEIVFGELDGREGLSLGPVRAVDTLVDNRPEIQAKPAPGCKGSKFI
jgi:RNA polymerase-binding transcription factor DksA